MTTIKDVARLAGVSITTVSMVLNKTNHKISDDTRKKVEDAANSLQYRPNSYAKALASKKTNNLMVVVPDISNPFFSLLVRELTKIAEDMGYFCYVHSTNNKNLSEKEFLSMVEKNYFMASLLVDRSAKNLSDKTIKKHNIIFLDEFDYNKKDINLVTGDNFIGGYMAVDYLIKKGFRKIAMMLGPSDTTNSTRRLSGAMRAFMDNDLYLDHKNIVHADYTYDGGYMAGKYLLDKNIDAIFSFSDLSSYGLINCFYENKIRIPEDISIISYDNLFFDNLLRPKLTSIDQNQKEIAKKSMEMVDSLINDRKVEKQILVKPKIIERESVGDKNENS